MAVLKEILVECSGEKVASERLGVYAKAMEESAKVAMENLGYSNPRHQLMAQGQMHQAEDLQFGMRVSARNPFGPRLREDQRERWPLAHKFFILPPKRQKAAHLRICYLRRILF